MITLVAKDILSILSAIKTMLALQKAKLFKTNPYTHAVVVTKKNYRGWLDAVELRAGWISKDEIYELDRLGLLDNKKIFVLIPIFKDELGLVKKLDEIGVRK